MLASYPAPGNIHNNTVDVMFAVTGRYTVYSKFIQVERGVWSQIRRLKKLASFQYITSYSYKAYISKVLCTYNAYNKIIDV
jgi:hypothetical protein